MQRYGRPLVAVLVIMSMCCAAGIALSHEGTCSGRYVMGDMDTRKDARSFALMEAKRTALEQGGTYLESSSEVTDYQLTKDEINSLAAGIVSVEVLDEKWEMSGESMVVTVTIRATVDTSNLNLRINTLRASDEHVEELKTIQAQLAALTKELEELRSNRRVSTSGTSIEASRNEQKGKYSDIKNRLELLEQLEIAEANLATGSTEKAAETFRNIVSTNPETAAAYTGLAITMIREGSLYDARKNIDQAIHLEPESPKAHAVKSRILMDLDQKEGALDEINKAIELNADNPKFFVLSGNIFLSMKKGKSAIKNFKKACSMGYHQACLKVKNLTQQRTKKR